MTNEVAQQSFYSTYFRSLLEHLFSVATDSSHAGNLMLHASILCRMFAMLEQGVVKVSIV